MRLDGLPDFPFAVEARDGEARAGRLETPRGVVQHALLHAGGHQGHGQGHVARPAAGRRAPRSSWPTPTTWRCARAATPCGAWAAFTAFMQWDGPILTDSGGYQVFSLRDTATHRRHRRGLPLHLRRLQARVHSRAGHGRAAGAGRRPHHVLRPVPARHRHRGGGGRGGARGPRVWAARCKEAHQERGRPGHRRAPDAPGHRAGGSDPGPAAGRAPSGCWRSAFPGTP